MYKKVMNEDEREKNYETPSLPEFKNKGDHEKFNKVLRGLTSNMNLLRQQAFRKIMVIGCSEEDQKM